MHSLKHCGGADQVTIEHLDFVDTKGTLEESINTYLNEKYQRE